MATIINVVSQVASLEPRSRLRFGGVVGSVQPFALGIRQTIRFSSSLITLCPGSLLMSRVIQFAVRLLSLTALVLLAQLSLKAQVVRQPPTPPTSMTADKSRPDSEDQTPTPLDYEMRAKQAIKYAEKEHQENLTRAREASELGNAVAAAFKQNKSLGSADLKKLEKLEKLTKKIRSEAGASNDEFELECKPQDLAEAVTSVAKVSTSLSEKVLKTPRRVVSAGIIEESNVLLELIRIVRTYVSK